MRSNSPRANRHARRDKRSPALCRADHGDTTTSTAPALVAFYRQIPIEQVEASLRTHNIHSPWLEGINRQIPEQIAI